jgi:hypothetical protein
MTKATTTITAQKVSAEIIIEDLENPTPKIVVSNSTSEEQHTLTLDEVNDIASVSYQLGSTVLDLINNTRINHYHPLSLLVGQESLKPKASLENSEFVVEDLARVTSLVPKNTTDLTFDGIPVLEWGVKNSENNQRNRYGARLSPSLNLNPEHGWRLYLTGAEKSTIGFASWNNLEAIENLVRQTQDSETLLIVSGITDPETTSTLTSRLNAREILEERAIKRITLKPLKKILSDNDFATPENDSRNNRALLRVLSIKFGKKNLPVACAILVPTTRRMEQDWENYSAQHHADLNTPNGRGKLYTLKQDFIKLEREKWQKRLIETINSDSEWRVVDLPSPDLGWRYREREYVWVTPLNEETWSVIEKAAELEASKTSMNRGAVF